MHVGELPLVDTDRRAEVDKTMLTFLQQPGEGLQDGVEAGDLRNATKADLSAGCSQARELVPEN